MNCDLVKAKELLKNENCTCVLCKGEQVYTSQKRGVAPLLGWLEQGIDLKGYSAADKVVGKAAAFLYRLMGVEHLYAGVVSQLALQLLKQENIACEYDRLVPAIRNRKGDGYCPMESAVKELDDPARAAEAIRQTLKRLQQK